MSDVTENSAVDLNPFCSKDSLRPYLAKPFSKGDWTYATNGHIAVRVPRRENVDGHPKAPNAEKIFAKVSFDDLAPLGKLKLGGKPKTVACKECDGRGTEHDCPGCTCTCDACDGSGEIEERVRRELRGATFDAKYLRLIVGLPNAHFSRVASKSEPSGFRFDGGEGLVMPMRSDEAEPAE